MTDIAMIAAALGIKPTRAKAGTEVYQAWEDRVLMAQSHTRKYRQNCATGSNSPAMERAQADRATMIADANRYAV